MPGLAGRLIAGRYRLVERIDRGGTAEVWRARDEQLDRDVAVKIRERSATAPSRAAAVSHPNIVTLFDEGQDGDRAFIVMEYVRGRTLRDLIAERGAIPVREAVGLVAQIAAALDATHRAGLVHLDVKPANVIVGPDGNAKLTDFGIARAARDGEEPELVGTARYIAPERVLGGAVTGRSDVYGLALVAYELLTGTPAFAGVENEDLLRDRIARGAPHIRSIDRGLTEAADEVVARALAREPKQRYATAGAFAQALAVATSDPVATTARPGRRGATDVAARSDRGLVRERNEDRWLVRSHAGTTLLAVADGVGGEDGGAVASTAAMAALGATFVEPSYRDTVRSSLAVAVGAANAAVLEAAKAERLPRAATTLVAAAVHGRHVAIANLGDSRAYLVRGTAVRQITTDHSGDQANSITRFIGDPRGVQPDIFVELLEPGDRLVLCSDGLTRHVTDEEIGRAVAAPAATAADGLVALARSRGGEDNVTVIVYMAGRPPVSRALLGTFILVLLLLVVVVGALGALVTTPVPIPSPGASVAPTAAP